MILFPFVYLIHKELYMFLLPLAAIHVLFNHFRKKLILIYPEDTLVSSNALILLLINSFPEDLNSSNLFLKIYSLSMR